MKKFGALLLAMAFASFAFGQYYYLPSLTPGNPGGINDENLEYPVGGGLPTTWSTLLGPGNASPTWSGVSTIPFAFNFNGSPVTDYKVSSSGVLTFDVAATVAPPYANSAIPNASIPDNSVMIWGIEGTGTNDNIVLQDFGTAPNRQHWVFFSSYTGGGSWSYWAIVLEETTDKIYIVDMRHATTTVMVTAGIQIDATTAYAVAGSPALGNLAGVSETDADNYYYEFTYGTLPDYDMAGAAIDIEPFLISSDAPFDVAGTFTNLGVQTITSFDINYSINGGAAVTAAVTGSTVVPTYSDVSWTSSIPWTPTATGSFTLRAWASNLNGNPDAVNDNDTTVMSVTVVDTFVQIIPLYETFTSSTCPPCVPANANMELLFAANPDQFTSLKYQMDFPGVGDPYYTAESGERFDYYNINSVPRVEISGGWDENGNSLTQGVMDQFYAEPAFVTIDASFTQEEDKTINVDVDLNPLVDIASTNLVMHVAIYETVTYSNVGSNGETEFFQVMKKMIPGAAGTSIAPLVANNLVTDDFTWTFQGDYRLPPNASSPINHANEHSVEDWNALGVLVWVQDANTKEVLQSAYASKIDITSGIENPALSPKSIRVYPNPTTELVNVQLELTASSQISAQLYNGAGAIVLSKDFGTLSAGQQQLELKLNDLASGLYNLHLITEEGSVVKPIFINN